MNALKPFAWSLAVALCLGSPKPVAAAPGSGGGGSYGSGSASHGSSSSHAAASSFHAAPRAFTSPRSGSVRSFSGSAKAPTFAFGGHAATPADPPARTAATAQRSKAGADRPAGGWDRHWDRIWHGRHYHWNNGAWAIINDGAYPWDDSYYVPSSADAYPDMSSDYGDTPSDAGAPNPTPNLPAIAAGPQEDSIAADVQQGLASRGYYDGKIDGVVGDATREAIADFQKNNDLQITGYITKSLLKALGL
jgi:hypothetical protein